MGKGAPDYTRVTEIRGQDPTGELVTLAVDANGQLYAVVKGIDGTTLRTLAVDANGQLIMVPRGQSGNYMSVDASGYMTSVMKGVDGVTLRTVAVDSSGNIIGVLQGDYAGALKTLAVDSQGRMLAVLTDPEDVFGNPHYMGAAELAVRLGSIHSFDRRGQVLLVESFEDGLSRWDLVGSVQGDDWDLSTQEARSGKYSLRANFISTQASTIEAIHRLPYPTLSIFGVEASFRNNPAYRSISISVFLYDGVNRREARLEYVPDTDGGRLQIFIGYAETLATNLALRDDTSLFHTMKLVFDATTGYYHRAILNDQVFDLAAYPLGSQADATAASIDVQLGALALSAVGEVLFDDIIVTTKEP